MAIQDYVSITPQGSPNSKTPFIIAMVDENLKLQTLPFPQTGELIYGVELSINPISLSSNLSKIINRSQSMVSYIEDHWGEELDTLTFQGHTAAFITSAGYPGTDLYSLRMTSGSPTQQFNATYKKAISGPGVGIDDSDPGLTVSQRRKSVSYIQFKKLVDIIRLNGCMFDSFGLVTKRYYIMLSYGNAAYKGYFENIDITETGPDPFRFQYTITYKSEQTIYSYVN
jgi:hypothetical protein